MTTSAASLPTASTTGTCSTSPISAALARTLRNDPSYDDWSYGTEPIPGDTAWITPQQLHQLHVRLVQRFEEAETVSYPQLAALALAEILTVPAETLVRLAQSAAPLVQ
jgi:hypothetical protein